MAEAVSCICGYRGPTVQLDGLPVCPICHTSAAPVSGGVAARSPAASRSIGPVPAAHGGAAKPKRYRIPCPRGHVLKAGEHMLGQQAVCPECNELFVLREADSLEHRLVRERARREAEERLASVWLTRALWAAVFIVASLAGMIAFSFFHRTPSPLPPVGQSNEPDPAARTD